MSGPDLLILGASTRAAAQSAIRGGLQPLCADRYADRDLSALAPVHRVGADDYPAGLERVAALAPRMAWLYSGALENCPELLERIASQRPLWGNSGQPLRLARDPLALERLWRAAGVPYPRVCVEDDGLPRDGSWLRKPLASAGGQSIERLVAGLGPAEQPSFFQEYVPGPSFSAVVLADQGQVTVAGITRQLLGGREGTFTYRGSIGPVTLPEAVRTGVRRLAEAASTDLGLRGLIGIDFILKDGLAWPVEINPRYTASVEVLERALGHALLLDHARVFDPQRDVSLRHPSPRHRIVGKAVVIANHSGLFRAQPGCLYDLGSTTVPKVADIPDVGAEIRSGEPVMTVFGVGRTISTCWRRLNQALRIWSRAWDQPASPRAAAVSGTRPHLEGRS
jgi:predicted ATP-grasp superfamily ATP-dependent carboligase